MKMRSQPGTARCDVIDPMRGKRGAGSARQRAFSVWRIPCTARHTATLGAKTSHPRDTLSDCPWDCPRIDRLTVAVTLAGLQRQVSGGERDRLRERRKRLDRVSQHVNRHLGTNRQRHLLKPLARLGPDCHRTDEDASCRVGEELDEPRSLRPLVARGSGCSVHLPRGADESVADDRPTCATCGSVKTTAGTAR